MNFNLDDTQQMLDDVVNRFVIQAYQFEQRRARLASPLGYSPELLTTLSELGLFGLNVPEEYGGIGGRPEDALVVLHRLGTGLTMEPYIESAIATARLLDHFGTATQRELLMPGLAAGHVRYALALAEPGTRGTLQRVASRAKSNRGDWRVCGRKSLVHHAEGADVFVVSALPTGHSSPMLFLVPGNAPGISIRSYSTIDNRRAAEVSFDDVPVAGATLIGLREGVIVPDLVSWLADQVVSAQVAEAVGVMEKLLQLTSEYLQTRVQFGKPLFEFQALQHKLADMAIWLEQARAAAHLAAADCLADDSSRRGKAIATAKFMSLKAGRLIGQTAIQLHGGMGMADEMACGHYVKRLTAYALSWGSQDDQLQRYGDLLIA